MMVDQERGLEELVNRYADDPVRILKAIGSVKYRRRLNDGHVICRAGDPAECV